MLYYKLYGGGSVAANSYQELATALWQSSQTESRTLEEFMEQTAQRCMLQTGAVISTYNINEFVTDLMHNGFLIEEVG